MSKEVEQGKKRVKEVQESLQRERDLHQPKANEVMAEDTPDFISQYDFWCDECEEDFTASAFKSVSRLFGDPIVAYRTKCPDCDNPCYRLISHKDHDHYYDKSLKVRINRNKYVVDVLQHEDYGFQTHYGNPFKEFEADMKKREEQIIQEEHERGFRGLSLHSQQELSRLYD